MRVRNFVTAGRLKTNTPSKDPERGKASPQPKERLAATDLVRPPRLGGSSPSAEEPFRSLVERIPAVSYIAECGIEGRWHYVSPQIEALLGYTPQEWTADNRLWPQRERGCARSPVRRSLTAGVWTFSAREWNTDDTDLTD